jgi:uncharacterized membrane protein YidH (DUF202 family)
MTSTLILLTVAAGYLLWALLLHFEEIRAATESEAALPRRAALLFLTLAGLLVVGTLAVVLVEVQQLFMPATS